MRHIVTGKLAQHAVAHLHLFAVTNNKGGIPQAGITGAAGHEKLVYANVMTLIHAHPAPGAMCRLDPEAFQLNVCNSIQAYGMRLRSGDSRQNGGKRLFRLKGDRRFRRAAVHGL